MMRLPADGGLAGSLRDHCRRVLQRWRSLEFARERRIVMIAREEGNPPIFSGREKQSYAAIASRFLGVMPPHGQPTNGHIRIQHDTRVAPAVPEDSSCLGWIALGSRPATCTQDLAASTFRTAPACLPHGQPNGLLTFHDGGSTIPRARLASNRQEGLLLRVGYGNWKTHRFAGDPSLRPVVGGL